MNDDRTDREAGMFWEDALAIEMARTETPEAHDALAQFAVRTRFRTAAGCEGVLYAWLDGLARLRHVRSAAIEGALRAERARLRKREARGPVTMDEIIAAGDAAIGAATHLDKPGISPEGVPAPPYDEPQ